jgi:hypothetical protein
MNPHDIPEASWLFLVSMRAIEWLNPIVHLLGLAVALWAFRCCRRWGYLVVGFYFLLVLFTLFAMPSINRAIQARSAPDISEQTQQKINAAVQQAIDRVLQEEGQSYAPPQKRTVRFPFGPIVLVVGLWLIARRDIDEHRANQRIGCKAISPGGQLLED